MVRSKLVQDPPRPMRQPKTAAEVVESVSWLAGILAQAEIVDEFTIRDYPLGVSARGHCKLSIDANNKGVRTVKQTWSPKSGWSKPHYSTYREYPIVVWALSPLFPAPHTAGWLMLSLYYGAYVSFPAGQGLTLIEKPCTRPRRKVDPAYEVLSYDLSGRVVGSYMMPEKQPDPPEVIEAWDAWNCAIRDLGLLAAERLKASRGDSPSRA